jgi:hypothetical protein
MLFFLRLVVLSSAGHESGQVFSPLQLSTIEQQFYAPTQHGKKRSFARGITTTSVPVKAKDFYFTEKKIYFVRQHC